MEETKSNNDVFTISYTGSFYGDITPVNFFKALNSFLKKDSLKKVLVQLVGVKTHFEIPKLLKDKVVIIPPVKHSIAIEIMQKSDVLLSIHRSSGRKGLFSGKLFEYLATLKPILGLMDENDVAASLIEECNAGYVSDNANIEKIEMILEEAYREWDEKKKRVFNIEIIKKHHRKEQVKRLEKLVEEL